ncbi:hypothetical protein MMC25_005156 [Agyrium rufum]|nr:hypothetical protein [Agyrium rufum]
MALEDFEKDLEQGKEKHHKPHESKRDEEDADRSKRHHHHRHHHRSHRNHDDEGHRRKRRRQSDEQEEIKRERKPKPRKDDPEQVEEQEEDEWVEKADTPATDEPIGGSTKPQRDAWMLESSGLEFDFTQRGTKKPLEPSTSKSAKADFELKIHANELNRHYLEKLRDGEEIPEEVVDEPAQHEVSYKFGDAGSQWRMTKLKNVYREAKETKQSVDDVAEQRYGDLRAFDDAREEEIELDRRETYGDGYVGNEKPSGDLFQDRKMAAGARRERMSSSAHVEQSPPPSKIEEYGIEEKPITSVQLDQTALNRLKAKMMKAQLRGSANAKALEEEYNNALAGKPTTNEDNVVVLNAMENRMLAGGRSGGVKDIENRRGRERGLVEEKEDMSIEDMVREERRTRGQAGGEGQCFAERIAKDAKFETDLDYLDENANKLAKRVQRSEINLRNVAVGSFQKLNKILDNCPLCHHEDTNRPPIAPIVSLATRVYLTLPPEPEIASGGVYIVPIQHRTNLLECDDDEWEEIRNFMKSLARHYHALRLAPLFYEAALSTPSAPHHAVMQCTPVPTQTLSLAPAFFREAILSSTPEWSQHRKIIDTLALAKGSGQDSRAAMGKWAFQRAMVKEMQYFHVWFEIDGGMGHVVEEGGDDVGKENWIRGVVSGMIGGGDAMEGYGRGKKGKWGSKESEMERAERFRKKWKEWDWTRVLLDG